MSQNNTIRKSDKKFIRKEKARIRREFSDVKKQEELINGLYKNFVKSAEAPKVTEATKEVKEKKEVKVEKPKAEVKKEKPAVKKAAPKKAAVK